MADILVSRLGLLAGVLLTLVGLGASVRPHFLFRARRAADTAGNRWFNRTFWLIVTTGTGVAILLINLPGARLFTMPREVQAWGLTAIGVLQVALGGAWLAGVRSPEWVLRSNRSAVNQWMLPLVPLVTGTVWLGLAVALPSGMTGAAVSVDRQVPLPVETRQSEPSEDALASSALIGMVQDGAFSILAPAELAGISVRLTGIAMQEARSPESQEVDLTPYEGRAIMVRGQSSGGWLYSAEVIDEGGPLLTALVERAFGR